MHVCQSLCYPDTDMLAGSSQPQCPDSVSRTGKKIKANSKNQSNEENIPGHPLKGKAPANNCAPSFFANAAVACVWSEAAK